jgi:hypothetical protein
MDELLVFAGIGICLVGFIIWFKPKDTFVDDIVVQEIKREKKSDIKHIWQEDDLGLWLGLGFAFQAIIFFVFSNDAPRGMERLKYIPIISAIASALTNTFIFESGKVGVRTFFAVSSAGLAYLFYNAM